MAALEKLATDTAIDNIKYIAMHSNVSYQASWMYWDAVSALGHAGRLKDLIDLALFYNIIGDSLLDALNKFEIDKVVQEIDKRLQVQEENKPELLQQLKDRLL